MRETDDGFRIAEEDLELRGAGELLGTRQSGLPQFRLADLAAHSELLAAARDDARLTVERDPELATTRGKALKVLLYLFESSPAVRPVRSGCPATSPSSRPRPRSRPPAARRQNGCDPLRP